MSEWLVQQGLGPTGPAPAQAQEASPSPAAGQAEAASSSVTPTAAAVGADQSPATGQAPKATGSAGAQAGESSKIVGQACPAAAMASVSGPVVSEETDMPTQPAKATQQDPVCWQAPSTPEDALEMTELDKIAKGTSSAAAILPKAKEAKPTPPASPTLTCSAENSKESPSSPAASPSRADKQASPENAAPTAQTKDKTFATAVKSRSMAANQDRVAQACEAEPSTAWKKGTAEWGTSWGTSWKDAPWEKEEAQEPPSWQK